MVWVEVVDGADFRYGVVRQDVVAAESVRGVIELLCYWGLVRLVAGCCRCFEVVVVRLLKCNAKIKA